MHTQQQPDTDGSVTTYQWMVFAICWLSGIFAGMNANLFSLMLPQAVQEVGGTMDRAAVSQIGSYILSLFLIGWMSGGLIMGMVGDRFGRVKAMTISILLYSVSTAMASFAETSWFLAFCRLLTGIGVGGCMLSISVMLTENWPSKSRAIAIGALITSYQVGVFLSGVISTFIPHWREAFAIGAIPTVLAFVSQTKLREPKEWLNKVQKEKASFLLHIKSLFGAEHKRNVIVGSMAFGGLLVGYWASIAWVPTWIQDIVESSSSGSEKSTATMFHAFAAIGGCFFAGWLANRCGRLPVILISCAGAFIVSAWMFLGFSEFSTAIYWLHGLLGAFIGIAQAVLYIYLPELFPTSIRATAVGFCLNCGRLVTAVAVLFVGLLVPLLGGYAFALFSFACVYLVAVGSSLIGNETRGKALPS